MRFDRLQLLITWLVGAYTANMVAISARAYDWTGVLPEVILLGVTVLMGVAVKRYARFAPESRGSSQRRVLVAVQFLAFLGMCAAGAAVFTNLLRYNAMTATVEEWRSILPWPAFGTALLMSLVVSGYGWYALAVALQKPVQDDQRWNARAVCVLCSLLLSCMGPLCTAVWFEYSAAQFTLVVLTIVVQAVVGMQLARQNATVGMPTATTPAKSAAA